MTRTLTALFFGRERSQIGRSGGSVTDPPPVNPENPIRGRFAP